MNDLRTIGRFAPTPSGRLHLGNIFTAMLAWLSARAKGGECLLRVEDLDRARCNGTAQMSDDLKWFGFRFADGGRQSERTALYDRYFEALRERGAVYPCWCTRGSLAAAAPHGPDGHPVYDGRCRLIALSDRPDRPPCWRVAVEGAVSLADGVQGNYGQDLRAECGDFIARRADGVYAYQFAVVVDDGLSGVTEVVRGRDLLFSAPRQIFLHRLLGFEPPAFYHVPLLLGPNGERLSKRDGAQNLARIRETFTRPEPIIGALACAAGLLDRPEPASLASLVPVFDWNKIKKRDAPCPEVSSCGRRDPGC